METKKNILNGHKAKLLGHRIKGKKTIQFFLWLSLGSLGTTLIPGKLMLLIVCFTVYLVAQKFSGSWHVTCVNLSIHDQLILAWEFLS